MGVCGPVDTNEDADDVEPPAMPVLAVLRVLAVDAATPVIAAAEDAIPVADAGFRGSAADVEGADDDGANVVGLVAAVPAATAIGAIARAAPVAVGTIGMVDAVG